jgi:hypothetical protein
MNWAVAQLQGDRRSVIAAVSCEDVVVMNGDKFAHDGGRTDFLSERRAVHGLFPNSTISADGTHPIWSFRLQMGDGFTATIVTENLRRCTTNAYIVIRTSESLDGRCEKWRASGSRTTGPGE